MTHTSARLRLIALTLLLFNCTTFSMMRPSVQILLHQTGELPLTSHPDGDDDCALVLKKRIDRCCKTTCALTSILIIGFLVWLVAKNSEILIEK